MKTSCLRFPGPAGALALTLSMLAATGRTASADGPVIYSGGGAPRVYRIPTGPRYIMPSGVGIGYQAGYAPAARPMVGAVYPRTGMVGGVYPRTGYANGGYYGYGANTGISAAPIGAPGYGYPSYGFGTFGYLNGTAFNPGAGYGGAYPNGYSYPGYGAGFGSASPAFGYNYRGFYPW